MKQEGREKRRKEGRDGEGRKAESKGGKVEGRQEIYGQEGKDE